MATKKMPIAQFVKELQAAVQRGDGYIMGARGQNPRTGYLVDVEGQKPKSSWKTTGWYYEQYADRSDYTEKQEEKALYWREHCERVWDCNGLAEGLYELFSGVNIDSKARYNYAQWCDPKGNGTIPTKYRVPGAAVFWGDKASSIHHVGYLEKPVDPNNIGGDWYIIEARGVMYGVVRTKLNARKPNFWGWMTKYFDYGYNGLSTAYKLGDRTLRNGDEGEDVKALQTNLIRLGYDCGKYGVDGEFGDSTELALQEFQKDHKLEVDGVYGEKSHAALEKAMVELDTPVENPKNVKIVGGDCWIRSEPNTTGKKLGVAKRDKLFEYGGATSENGWNQIIYEKTKAWVSGKYSEVVK